MSLHNNLPSIGSINLLNTYRQMNCVTLSDSGAVMAAGMSDSTVKVFILSKKSHDVLTVDDLIKQQIETNIKILKDSINEDKNSKGGEFQKPQDNP